MTTPVRIQLSRRRGFRLQQVSLALNGLPAVKCDRATRYGNPFAVGEMPPLSFSAYPGAKVETAEQAVAMFRQALLRNLAHYNFAVDTLLELRNKNLGCWCKLPVNGATDLCHAAVLLELANIICEKV